MPSCGINQLDKVRIATNEFHLNIFNDQHSCLTKFTNDNLSLNRLIRIIDIIFHVLEVNQINHYESLEINSIEEKRTIRIDGYANKVSPVYGGIFNGMGFKVLECSWSNSFNN